MKAMLAKTLEDDVFKIICEERDRFERQGPAKTLDDLWQRKAARRITALVEQDWC